MKFIKAIITVTSLFIGSTAFASTCTDYVGDMASLNGYDKKVITVCTKDTDSIIVNNTLLNKVNDRLYVTTFASEEGEYAASFHYLNQKGYWVYLASANADEISIAFTIFVDAPKEL